MLDLVGEGQRYGNAQPSQEVVQLTYIQAEVHALEAVHVIVDVQIVVELVDHVAEDALSTRLRKRRLLVLARGRLLGGATGSWWL